MNKTYLFISDVHLGLQSKEIEDKKERQLVKFLEFAKDNCDELFIAGIFLIIGLSTNEFIKKEILERLLLYKI